MSRRWNVLLEVTHWHFLPRGTRNTLRFIMSHSCYLWSFGKRLLDKQMIKCAMMFTLITGLSSWLTLWKMKGLLAIILHFVLYVWQLSSRSESRIITFNGHVFMLSIYCIWQEYSIVHDTWQFQSWASQKVSKLMLVNKKCSSAFSSCRIIGLF